MKIVKIATKVHTIYRCNLPKQVVKVPKMGKPKVFASWCDAITFSRVARLLFSRGQTLVIKNNDLQFTFSRFLSEICRFDVGLRSVVMKKKIRTTLNRKRDLQTPSEQIMPRWRYHFGKLIHTGCELTQQVWTINRQIRRPKTTAQTSEIIKRAIRGAAPMNTMIPSKMAVIKVKGGFPLLFLVESIIKISCFAIISH